MKLYAALLLGALGTTAFGADPDLVRLIPAGATVVAGANVTNARLSPLGQFLIAKMPGDLSALSSSIGFDPLHDVTEALGASSGKGGFIALKGVFAPEKLAASVGAQNVSTYGGATLISPDAKTAVAFIGSTEAIAGDPASVKAAIDRSNAPSAVDAATAAQVNTLSLTEDAWVLSSVSPATMAPAQAAQILTAVTSLTGGVKFGDTIPVNLDLVANTPENAEALANVVKFIVSMATTSKDAAASSLDWLKSLQVATSGTKVAVSLTVPEAQVEALFNSMQKPAAAARKGN